MAFIRLDRSWSNGEHGRNQHDTSGDAASGRPVLVSPCVKEIVCDRREKIYTHESSGPGIQLDSYPGYAVVIGRVSYAKRVVCAWNHHSGFGNCNWHPCCGLVATKTGDCGACPHG